MDAIDVKGLVAEMGPQGEQNEAEVVATEGLTVAAEEIMEAFSASDKDALVDALRNFIKIARL